MNITKNARRHVLHFLVLSLVVSTFLVFPQTVAASNTSTEATYIPISGTPLLPRPVLIDGLSESEYPQLINEYRTMQFLQVDGNSYAVGDQETFWAQDNWFYTDGTDNDGDGSIDDFDESMYQLTATCQRLGSHCYVFVEDGESVSDANLDYVMNQFDNTIYTTDTATFGSEPNPGVDNDARIFILLMDIRDQNYHDRSYPFYIGGYFWSLHEHRNADLAPPQAGYSNEKEIIHIDINPGDEGDSGGTMAHEFQHMIHWNQDSNEETWIDEGCADYAEYVCYGTHPMSHVNAFRNNPNTQLNSWGGIGTRLLAHYGASYLFILYLAEKYGGAATIGTLVAEDANGIAGVDASLSARGYTQRFEDVFSTWIIANYLDNPTANNLFGYTSIDLHVHARDVTVPATFSEENPVEEYASEYVEITPPREMVISFDGNWLTDFNVQVLRIDGSTVTVDTINLNWQKDGSIEIPTTHDRIGLVIAREEDLLGDGTYTVRVSAIVRLDVYMLVDLSGSFADDLPIFKVQAPNIISNLKASNPNTRFGLGKFEDYPIPPFGYASWGDKAYERVIDLTFDSDAVLSCISALFTRYGGDGPQSQLPALYQAATGAGQDLSGVGFPEASIPPGQQANFRDGATKLFILWTDAPFHNPGDPGTIPYPGPSFDQTVEAINALDPPMVIGISSGSGGVADLKMIATATGALAPVGGVDTNGDGIIDILEGEPLVCAISSSGVGIAEAIESLVEAAAVLPVADADGPYEGETGTPLLLDGSNSFDSDGYIVLYEWDFDGDGTFDFSSTDSTVSHTYVTAFTGVVILRVTDNEGNTDTDEAAITIVQADNIPPETWLVIGDPKCLIDGTTYLTSVTSVTLFAEDDLGGTGVASTSYRIYSATYDSGWLVYSASFYLTGLSDGEYSIDYYSTDNVGNTEATNATSVILDNTGPLITVSNPPAGWSLQDGVTFLGSITDAGCGVFSMSFSIREANDGDGIPIGFEDLPASYDSSTGEWSFSFDTLLVPDGYYVLYIEAEDNLGNEASKTASYSIRNWAVIELLPSSESNKAGRTMPVKFALRVAAEVDPNQPFVYNEELRIEIFATADPDNVLQESYYGDTARDYRISSRHYITNFKTLKTPMEYTVAIYRDTFDVGSFTFETVK